MLKGISSVGILPENPPQIREFLLTDYSKYLAIIFILKKELNNTQTN